MSENRPSPSESRLTPRVAALLRRRSYRAYRTDPLPAGAADAMRVVAAAAPTVTERRSGYALLLEGEAAARIPPAAFAGVIGKINPWLAPARPPAVLVLAGDSETGARDGDRHWYNVEAAVAGQFAAIEAAGRGVGTCWVGGFHEKSVAKAASLPDGHRPLAILPVGLPLDRSGGRWLARTWDAGMQKLVSGRRKPLSRIGFLGRYGEPFPSTGTTLSPDRGIEGGVEGWPGLGEPRPAVAFDSRPVPREALYTLLECARWAPSAENSQIARHVVVEGPDAVSALLRAAGVERELTASGAAPSLAVLSLAAPFVLKSRTAEQPFALIDVPIAVANLLLAAADFGLGWRVAWRFDFRGAAEQLGAPADHRAIALTLFGFPPSA